MALDLWFREDVSRILASTHEAMRASMGALPSLDPELAETYRRGFSDAAIQGLKDAYKTVYRSGLTVEQALHELTPLSTQYPEVAVFTDFVRNAERGIIR